MLDLDIENANVIDGGTQVYLKSNSDNAIMPGAPDIVGIANNLLPGTWFRVSNSSGRGVTLKVDNDSFPFSVIGTDMGSTSHVLDDGAYAYLFLDFYQANNSITVFVQASSTAAPPTDFTDVSVTGTLTVGGTATLNGATYGKGSIGVSYAGDAPSATNSGITLSAATDLGDAVFFDSSRTVNNRSIDVLWRAGSFEFRFKNDAGSSATTAFSINGGYASGITGITSNSGTGSWTHTGPFTSTGSQTVLPAGGNGVVITGSAAGGVPSIASSGANSNVTLAIAAKGGGAVQINSPLQTGSSADILGPVIVGPTVGNRVQMSGNASGVGLAYVTVESTGTGDANIDIQLKTQGTGVVKALTNTVVQGNLTVGPNAGNAVVTTGAASGSAVGIAATGTDANIDLELQAKGTGVIKSMSMTVLSGGFTVAQLPAASAALRGARAYVTDATAPTFLGALTGGGSVVCPVFCNGTAWVSA